MAKRSRSPVAEGFRAPAFWGLAALATFLLAECIVQGRLALRYNPDWEIREATIERSVSHARFFRDQRVSIVENGLNLGAWHGNNEIIFRRPLDFDRLELKAEIATEAYVAIFFNYDENGYAGVRLSRSPLFESMYFEASPGGEFRRRENFEFHLADSGAHEFILEAGAPGETRLLLDGKFLRALPRGLEKGKRFGFRNGELSVVLESVVVKAGGAEIAREDFRSRRGYLWILLLSGAVVLAAAALAAAYGLLRLPELERFGPLIAAGLILFGSGAFYAFDRYWLSRLSFFHDGQVQGRVILRPGQQYEKFAALANRGYRDRSLPYDGIQDPASRARAHGNEYRILFLGGSQTFGEGAAHASEAWPNVLVERWKENVDFSVVGTNAAHPGATSTQMRINFEKEYAHAKFDLVIVNLGTNDKFLHDFLENMESLAAKVRESGSDLIFVLEPNCVESDDEFLMLAHAKMLAVAARFRVPVLDLHYRFLQKRVYDSGFLWWDHVHLSSFGQSLFVDGLLANLNELARAGGGR